MVDHGHRVGEEHDIAELHDAGGLHVERLLPRFDRRGGGGVEALVDDHVTVGGEAQRVQVLLQLGHIGAVVHTVVEVAVGGVDAHHEHAGRPSMANMTSPAASCWPAAAMAVIV
jgi:hypothetical protein